MNNAYIMSIALILALIRESNAYAITDNSQQQIILEKHNEVRSLAATGKISVYGFETATKMYPLTWSNTLAETAERLASSCVFEHNNYGTSNGQNLAAGGGGTNIAGIGVPDEQPQGTSGCSNCYGSDEEAIKFLQYAWITGANEITSGPNAGSHFTQMVDDGTKSIGCALTNNCEQQMGYKYYLVCNYDHTQTGSGYSTGAIGSQCGANTVGTDGLCGSGSTGTNTAPTLPPSNAVATPRPTNAISTPRPTASSTGRGGSVDEICRNCYGSGESSSCNNDNVVRTVFCNDCDGIGSAFQKTFTFGCPRCQCNF
eukprot:163489_1